MNWCMPRESTTPCRDEVMYATHGLRASTILEFKNFLVLPLLGEINLNRRICVEINIILIQFRIWVQNHQIYKRSLITIERSVITYLKLLILRVVNVNGGLHSCSFLRQKFVWHIGVCLEDTTIEFKCELYLVMDFDNEDGEKAEKFVLSETRKTDPIYKFGFQKSRLFTKGCNFSRVTSISWHEACNSRNLNFFA